VADLEPTTEDVILEKTTEIEKDVKEIKATINNLSPAHVG